MKTQNKKPTTIESAMTSLPKLAELKDSMKFDTSDNNLTIGEKVIYIPVKLLSRAVVEGFYRQLSQETSGKDSLSLRNEIIDRFSRGYFTPRDEKAATQVTTPSGKKSQSFGPVELLAQARSMTNDEKTLHTLDIIAGLGEVKQAATIALAISKADGNIIFKAHVELTERAQEKAEAEAQRLEDEANDILAGL